MTPWPSLAYAEWKDTASTLHMLTQMVGKIRLARMPAINHWWQVTLYVSARGLTTGAMPCEGGAFQIEFDFIDHVLSIERGEQVRAIQLTSKPVADYYRELMAALRELKLETHIWPMPVEIDNAIRFDRDTTHCSYDPQTANRFWRALVEIDRVFTIFRSRFIGKVSPPHLFWGGFDFAVTRFSGRRAPRHGPVPNTADHVVQEAYSHEVSSAGFWPGSDAYPEPVFYSYAYPEPARFGQARVGPAEAFYNKDFGEFMLPYEAVRNAASPDAALLEFLQTTYDAAAELGKWDRAAMER